MKKIIVPDKEASTIDLGLVNEHSAIFAKKEGELKGMIVNEPGKGWILRLGGAFGANGHYNSLMDCLVYGQSSGYEFYCS